MVEGAGLVAAATAHGDHAALVASAVTARFRPAVGGTVAAGAVVADFAAAVVESVADAAHAVLAVSAATAHRYFDFGGTVAAGAVVADFAAAVAESSAGAVHGVLVASAATAHHHFGFAETAVAVVDFVAAVESFVAETAHAAGSHHRLALVAAESVAVEVEAVGVGVMILAAEFAVVGVGVLGVVLTAGSVAVEVAAGSLDHPAAECENCQPDVAAAQMILLEPVAQGGKVVSQSVAL
jgi:hypothetical protein